MKNTLEITKGKFQVEENKSYFEVRNASDLGKNNYCTLSVMTYDKHIDPKHLTDEAKSNANLVCEAFNVANETGMTPIMLRDRLREAEKYINEMEGNLKQAGV